MQILDKLLSMPPEEGVALMKQIFNPMRGAHVGYVREEDRATTDRMAKEKQNKV